MRQACYYDIIMGTMATLITSLTSVYSTVHPDADQRKHQSSASLAFVWGIHRRPVNSPHKWPATRKMFPFDDVIILLLWRLCFALFAVKAYKPTITSVELDNWECVKVTWSKQPNKNMPTAVDVEIRLPWVNWKTDRQIDRQIETGRQTGKQTGRRAGRQTDKETDRRTNMR